MPFTYATIPTETAIATASARNPARALFPTITFPDEWAAVLAVAVEGAFELVVTTMEGEVVAEAVPLVVVFVLAVVSPCWAGEYSKWMRGPGRPRDLHPYSRS
jgi:hypothetical protein